jgi:hypothetical protein
VSDQQMPPSQQQVDYAKWPEELRRRDAERTHDAHTAYHRAGNEAALKTSELALRMSLLINGGAAVALLTFVGSLDAKQKVAIADSLIWFAGGVVLAVLAIGAAYFTHYFTVCSAASKQPIWDHPYFKPGPRTQFFSRLTSISHVAALLLGSASLAMFVCGVLAVRSAFGSL